MGQKGRPVMTTARFQAGGSINQFFKKLTVLRLATKVGKTKEERKFTKRFSSFPSIVAASKS